MNRRRVRPDLAARLNKIEADLALLTAGINLGALRELLHELDVRADVITDVIDEHLAPIRTQLTGVHDAIDRLRADVDEFTNMENP